MTSKEREARRLFKWAVNHFGGDMRRLELALWREVKRRDKLPMITPNKNGAPLKPYRTPEA